jgi:acyl-CoA thioester hydrolase
MTKPHFVLIPIRYGDLDAQGHVNNARTLTFVEHARITYLKDLGLWDGVDFLNLGLIVADAHIAYRAPIEFGAVVRATGGVVSMGNKSMRFTHKLEDDQTGQLYAEADMVMVAYDYHTKQSILIPDDWREKIAAFEGIPTKG